MRLKKGLLSFATFHNGESVEKLSMVTNRIRVFSHVTLLLNKYISYSFVLTSLNTSSTSEIQAAILEIHAAHIQIQTGSC